MNVSFARQKFLARYLFVLFGRASFVGCASVCTVHHTNIQALPEIDQQSWVDSVQELTSPEMHGRGVDTPGINKACNYLLQQFQRTNLEPGFVDEQGNRTYFQTLIIEDVDGHQWETSNIAAILPGYGDLASEFVVFGAHYDHIGYGPRYSRMRGDPRWQAAPDEPLMHPGADDNASGVASMLSIAQSHETYWQSNKQSRRTLVFVAFTGEEWGLYGSRRFISETDALPFELEKIHAVVIADMVGRVQDRRLFVYWTSSNPFWRRLARMANEGIDLRLLFDEPIQGVSDEWPFLRRNIPVILVTNGRHPDYHTPADTFDRLNIDGAMQVTQLLNRLVLMLLTQSASNQQAGS